MKSAALTAALIALLCGCARESDRPTADLVVRNGDVRTMVSDAARASGIVVVKGMIAYVGPDEDVAVWIGPKTRIIDAGGHTVLPGLIDSHIHAAEGALALSGCTLHDEKLTVAQAADTIRGCAKADTTSTWIVVNEVNPAGFKATRQDLDAIEKHRPLFLWGTDGHTAWVNTRALELAGITRKTPNPPTGASSGTRAVTPPASSSMARPVSHSA